MEEGGGGAVRSRWTPKPEQIMILESLFEGGLVNPPKEETVRIRKLLEKFGAVGDANIFYWFQNRRSRSRRRHRQLQATLLNNSLLPTTSSSTTTQPATSSIIPPPTPHLHFQSGPYMTVYINGVAREVPKEGPIELGDDVALVHSSGVTLPTNQFGILQHYLQPGETYFLVPRPPVSNQ